jgi:hypothetical protein
MQQCSHQVHRKEFHRIGKLSYVFTWFEPRVKNGFPFTVDDERIDGTPRMAVQEVLNLL